MKKEPKKEPIPNQIAQLRKKLGKSQAEFGEPIGAARFEVSRYEAGQHLTVKLLLDIKKAYNVSLDEIMFGENQNSLSKEELIDLKNSLEDMFSKALKHPKANV